MSTATLTAALLEQEGLSGAVRALNDGVPHRYTGIFLRDGATLRNVALFDKLKPDPPLWAPFPVEDSFCSLVVASGVPLIVHDVPKDPRGEIRIHPASKTVRAYCGVPLMDSDGHKRGTLCHFDESPIEATVDLDGMLRIPPLLLPYL